MGRKVLLLKETEIRSLLDARTCIEAVEEAFSSYAGGKAQLPGVIGLDVPEHRGEIHIKCGHISGGATYAIKIASGFGDNTKIGLPDNDGMVLVFEARTGSPAAFLMDNGFITDLRTGAAGAVAAKHLARKELQIVAVIGSGGQACIQVELLSYVRSFKEVRVYGRSSERVRVCTDALSKCPEMPEGCTFHPAASVQEAVEGADIVITVTSSREPLVRAEWINPGALITAVGSDDPGKQELYPEVLASADRIVADSLAQCLRLGEIHHAVDKGIITEKDVSAELGEITLGRKPGRQSEDEIIVCDLTGVGVQDVAAASVVLQRAREKNLGELWSI